MFLFRGERQPCNYIWYTTTLQNAGEVLPVPAIIDASPHTTCRMHAASCFLSTPPAACFEVYLGPLTSSFGFPLPNDLMVTFNRTWSSFDGFSLRRSFKSRCSNYACSFQFNALRR